MYRIKNVRNSTVTKQANVSLPPLSPDPQLKDNKKVIVNIPHKLVQKVGKSLIKPIHPHQNVVNKRVVRLKLPQSKHKVTLISKAHQEEFHPIKLNTQIKNVIKADWIETQSLTNPQKQKEHKQQIKEVYAMPIDSKSKQQKQQPQNIKESSILNNQLSVSRSNIMTKNKIEQVEVISIQKVQKIDEKLQDKHQQFIYEQLEQLEKRQQEKKKRKKDQEQIQERETQAKLKQMVEKINARRKAREEQREKRIKIQENVKISKINSSNLGGLVVLSDPLAHVQMSQVILDAQIDYVLNQDYSKFPNKDDIQLQIQQLDRINSSYTLVRTDPTNSLNRGLSNFRIQLFNKVGELVMKGHSLLDSNHRQFQIINADSRNQPQIRGVRVTRGLQGHVKDVLKLYQIKHEDECAVCLQSIEIGQNVYDVRCGHKFHQQCLEEWVSTNANCPACRYNIKFDLH